MEINPKHPFTILEVSLTALERSTSVFGRNSTTACEDEFCAALKTRTLEGHPRRSSCELVTKQRVLGLSIKKRYMEDVDVVESRYRTVTTQD